MTNWIGRLLCKIRWHDWDGVDDLYRECKRCPKKQRLCASPFHAISWQDIEHIPIKTIDCKDCHFSNYDEYDPSPSGVHLAAGTISDWWCSHPDYDEFPERFVDEHGKCPCGTPRAKRYCPIHDEVYDYDCSKCIEEQWKHEQELSREGADDER